MWWYESRAALATANSKDAHARLGNGPWNDADVFDGFLHGSTSSHAHLGRPHHAVRPGCGRVLAFAHVVISEAFAGHDFIAQGSISDRKMEGSMMTIARFCRCAIEQLRKEMKSLVDPSFQVLEWMIPHSNLTIVGGRTNTWTVPTELRKKKPFCNAPVWR